MLVKGFEGESFILSPVDDDWLAIQKIDSIGVPNNSMSTCLILFDSASGFFFLTNSQSQIKHTTTKNEKYYPSQVTTKQYSEKAYLKERVC